MEELDRIALMGIAEEYTERMIAVAHYREDLEEAHRRLARVRATHRTQRLPSGNCLKCSGCTGSRRCQDKEETLAIRRVKLLTQSLTLAEHLLSLSYSAAQQIGEA